MRNLREENKRFADRARDVELENDKLKQDNDYLIQRTDADIQKL